MLGRIRLLLIGVLAFGILSLLNSSYAQAEKLGPFDIPEFSEAAILLHSSTTSTSPAAIQLGPTEGIYHAGDKLNVSGTVTNFKSNTVVTVRVLDPNDHTVTIGQVIVSLDKSFETSITLGGPSMNTTGIYTIQVIYLDDSIEKHFWFDSGNPTQEFNDVLAVHNWLDIVKNCYDETCEKIPRLWGPSNTTFSWFDVDGKVVNAVVQEKEGNYLKPIYDKNTDSDVFSYTFDRPGEYVVFLETDHILSILRIYTAEIVYIDDSLEFSSGTIVHSSSTSTVESTSPVYQYGDSAEVRIPNGGSVPGCEKSLDCFLPSSLAIDKGTTVIWSNDDSAAHTVTAGNPHDGPNGNFDSGLVFAGKSFSHTFESTGSFEYFCMIHPWMKGTVTSLNPYFNSEKINDTPEKPTVTDSDEDFANGKVDVSSASYVKGSLAKISIPQGTSSPGCETTSSCFIPSNLVIEKGTTVTWSNDDTAAHTVTAGTAADGPSGKFDSSLFMTGTTYSHVFDTLGTFEYFCMVHPWMTGTVTVIDHIPDDSGGNEWNTRPTFGMSNENNYIQIVENGFSFNSNQYSITDNHHTPFKEQSIEVGTTNSFAATVYAQKGLKVQEFLFGIPHVGESQLAELGVEVWFETNGDIDDIHVVQKSDVIDKETLVVSHSKVKCHSADNEENCDNTAISMKFLEPLKDKVMAIKAIDYKNRDQRTYLNEGFDISGNSLNPLPTQLIPSEIKNQGLVKVKQLSKYSPYWVSDDGRMFEMNGFGSFKEINQKFERFQDLGEARTRLHSGFEGKIFSEQQKAIDVFDATKLISDLPDSFGFHSEVKERMTPELNAKMVEQEKIAKQILEDSRVQARW